jgi:signal transduction histidine kinase
VRKRISQKTTASQKSTVTTYSIKNKDRAIALENIELLSPKLPATKQSLQLSLNYLSQLVPLQRSSIILMHSQADFCSLDRKINQIVLSNFDTETTLQQISQAWREGFGVDCCLIILIDENRQLNQTGYWSREEFFNARALQYLQLSELMSLLSQVELLTIDDVHAVSNSLPQWRDLALPIRAVLSIPIYFQGKQNGAIVLGQLHPYQWRDCERSRAQIAAESVAIALRQIAQVEEIASLEKSATTFIQYQNAVNQLIMASRTTLDLNQILQLAIAGTSQALKVERGLIITLKYSNLLFKNLPKNFIPKAKVTVISEWNNTLNSNKLSSINALLNQASDIPTVLNQSFWLNECSLCQQALINAPAPFLLNCNEETNLITDCSEINPILNITKLPSLLMFPLENQGTVFGFLLMQNSTSRTWQAEELALLELVSVQVSTAIIQNQTLSQVQSLVEERTAQLQRSLEVQSKLYEKTRQQIDQLKQINKLKDDFIDTISHELRTPLTSMNLAIRMLRTPGISIERKSKYLDILEQQCTQEISLINDLLRLQKLESNQTPLNLQIIKINSKLDDLVQIHTETWLAKELTVTVNLPEKPLLLQTDADSFERILHELLTNAGKYADFNTNIVVQATQQGDRLIITVTNIGAAILPEDAIYIFDKFRRGHGVTNQAIKGTGLGLALVKSLVQHLNGTIEVASTPIEQSSSALICFTLTLPQLPVPN